MDRWQIFNDILNEELVYDADTLLVACEKYFRKKPLKFIEFCYMTPKVLANDCEMTLKELKTALKRNNKKEMQVLCHICLEELTHYESQKQKSNK